MELAWKTYKLEQLVELQNGYAFKAADFRGSGIPIIKIKNIQSPKILLENTEYYSGEISGRLQQFIIRRGDILISMTGSHISQIASAVGKVGRYGFNDPALLNQRVGKLYSRDETKLDNDFLYYLIARPEVQFELATNAGGSANQANISPQQIKNLEFEIPDIKVQKGIASILSSFDDKIELNRRMNQTLEQIAATLFKKYFVDDIDPDNLPEGWRWGRLADVCVNYDNKRIPLSSRQREEKRGEFPYYGAASLMDYVDEYLFDGIYVLVGEDGTVVDDRGFPVLQYVWGKFWVNNHAHVLQGKGISSNHLYMILKNSNVAHLVTGAVQPKINQGNLNNLEVVIPDTETATKFEREIDELFALVRNNFEEIQTLQKLRDTLLPRLMSGEIDLSAINQNSQLHAEVPS